MSGRAGGGIVTRAGTVGCVGRSPDFAIHKKSGRSACRTDEPLGGCQMHPSIHKKLKYYLEMLPLVRRIVTGLAELNQGAGYSSYADARTIQNLVCDI